MTRGGGAARSEYRHPGWMANAQARTAWERAEAALGHQDSVFWKRRGRSTWWRSQPHWPITYIDRGPGLKTATRNELWRKWNLGRRECDRGGPMRPHTWPPLPPLLPVWGGKVTGVLERGDWAWGRVDRRRKLMWPGWVTFRMWVHRAVILTQLPNLPASLFSHSVFLSE